MSSDGGKLMPYCVAGIGAGIYFFFKGFRIYREYRVLADTPEIPIRSIPMGLVEIHGKAKGEQLVNSPVTRTPCFFYKVDIEKYEKDSRGRGSWQNYKTDADGVLFYLEDGSGKVLVDAHWAEYDLIQCGRRETSGGTLGLPAIFRSGPDINAPPQRSVSDSDLVSYAESVHSVGGFSAGGSLERLALGGLSFGGGSSGRYRFTEYCILPEHWYDITGTCVENPNPKDEHDRNMIVKGQNEPTFLISWRSEKELEKNLRQRAAKYVFGGAALAILCLAVLLAKLGWF